MSDIISYDPPLAEHPNYATTPDFDVGDAVVLLGYSGIRVIRNDDGEVIGHERYLSDDALEANDGTFTSNNHLVTAIEGAKVEVQFGGTGSTEWIPRDRIIGVDAERTQELHDRRRRRLEHAEAVKQRVEDTDMDALMDDVVIPHARKVAAEVWNDTIDPDDCDWFWNKRLRRSAGMCYPSARSSPQGIGGPAIGLAPGYYYLCGVDDLLEVVRHELIHLWQVQHPDGGKPGHGPKFRQWVGDCDTHRHCKPWSGSTVTLDGEPILENGRPA